MLASTLSNSSARRPSRRWSLVIGALLLTLLAHLLVLQWLNNQLERIAFFDDADDESAISVSLLRPDPQRAAPPPRKLTPPAPSLPPPVPAIAANDQAAVADKPATETPPAAPTPSTEAPPPSPTDAVVEFDAVKGNVLAWKCEADLESGLAQFVIERDGEVIARIPEKQNNPFGRSLFQGLQYSDTPPQPLTIMEFIDPHSQADPSNATQEQTAKQYIYRIHAINTVGKPSDKTQFVPSQSTP
jgi:hypothetical protein